MDKYGTKYSVGLPSNIITSMPISKNCFSSQNDVNAYTDGTVMSYMCSVSSVVLWSVGDGYQSVGGENKSILKFEKYLSHSSMVSHIHHYNSLALCNRHCAMENIYSFIVRVVISNMAHKNTFI